MLLLSTSATAREPAALHAGFVQERTLGPNENHVYSISLDEGAAVLGEADQHGVDLVIDEFGPNGKLIRTVDTPNGTEGPEHIDLTAFTTGQYKLVIHTLDPSAKPGKYIIKIDRIVNEAENAARIAEKNYPPALAALWKEYVQDPGALDRFIGLRKGKGPLIGEARDDNNKIDPNNLDVTYLYYGDEHTERVEVFGSTHASAGGTQLQRFLRLLFSSARRRFPKMPGTAMAFR